MKCLNLNIPQFRQAVAVLGQARATEVINTFDDGYLPTINEIIDRHNTYFSKLDINTLKTARNLGLENAKNAQDIVDILSRFTTRSGLFKIFEQFGDLSQIKINYVYINNIYNPNIFIDNSKTEGRYTPSRNKNTLGEISIDFSMLDKSLVYFTSLFMHELIHAKYDNLMAKGLFTGALVELFDIIPYVNSNNEYRFQFASLFNKIKEVVPKEDWEKYYGMTDVDEFIAEAYTNKSFQNFLKTIQINKGKDTVLTRLIRFLYKILGRDVFKIRNFDSNAFEAFVTLASPTSEVVDIQANIDLNPNILTESVVKEEDLPQDIGVTTKNQPITNNKLSIDQKVTLEQTGELLTPAEAAKMYEDYVPQSFFKLLRSWFFKVPTTNSNEANGIKIVDSAYLAYKTGREAYGAFIDGVIYLANLGTNEDARVNKDTLKHELVHKIMWGYLSAAERNRLLKLVSEKNGLDLTNESMETIEEIIADEFINYKNKPTSFGEKLTFLMRKIFRAIGLMSLHYNEMTQFFDDVSRGMFTGRPNTGIRVTRLMEKKIKKRFGNIQNYKNARDYVLASINKLIQFPNIDGVINDATNPSEIIRNGTPITFEEAVLETKRQIAIKLNNFEKNILKLDGIQQATKDAIIAIDNDIKELEDDLPNLTDPEEIQETKLAIENLRKTRSNKVNEALGELNEEAKNLYNVVRSLTNKENFNTIIDYLYPNASLYVATEVNEAPVYGNALKSEEAFNMNDEIGSKEDIDLRMNIISRVKQLLGTIQYTENGVVKYVPFNMAYAILLKSMGNFDLSRPVPDQLEYIRTSLNNYGSTPMINAIKLKLESIIIDSFPTTLEQNIPYFQFKSNGVAVLDTNLGDVRFVSLDTILYNTRNNKDNGYVVYTKQEKETQKDFLVRIYNDLKSRYPENKIITNPRNIVSSYRRFSTLNILANLHTSLVSMRERAPFIAERKYLKGKLTYQYFPVRDSGTNAVYVSNIKDSIIRKISNGFTGPIPSTSTKKQKEEKIKEAKSAREFNRVFSYLSIVQRTSNTSQKVTQIKDFLELIDNSLVNGILKKNPKVIENFSNVDIIEIHNALKEFLKALNNSEPTQSAAEFVTNLEVKFTNLIAGKLHNLDEGLAPVNYIAGDGKGKYKFALSSWGMEVFKKFSSSFYRGVGKSLEYLNTQFYSRNIFVEAGNRLIRYFDHDSSKIKGLDSTAVLHKNETPSQWFSRNLNNMFLGVLMNNNFDSYYQQVFTISDKPNILGAQVKFIKPDEARALMKKLVIQEAYRNKSLVSKISNYTPEKSYLVGVSKVATLKNNKVNDEEVESLTDDFERGIDKIAEQILDYILNNKIFLQDEVQFNLDKFLTEEQKKAFKDDPVMNATLKDLFKQLTKASYEKSLERNIEEEDNDSSQSEEESGLEIADLSDLEALGNKANNAPKDETLDQSYDEYYAQNIENIRKLLRPMAKSFAVNFYINSHQLSQLLAGDLAFYKNNSESYDIIKRMSLVFAPGKSGAVNNTYFLPETTRVMVMEDLNDFITPEEAANSNLPEIEGDSYTSTDGQVYMTPAYFERLKLAHGAESEQGYVLKPVFFGMDKDGVPRSLKCSVIVLTDELVEQFPGLAKLKNMMEAENIHMAGFASAVKTGVPAKLTKLYARDKKGNILKNEDGTNKLVDEELAVPNEIEPESIIELDSRNLRLQFNPAKKVIGKVTNPSQMTYMGAINQFTIDIVDDILERNAKIIKYGRTVVNRTFRLFNGKITKSKNISRKIIKNKLISTLSNINGSEAEADILDNPNASLNLPMIVNKMINNLVSVFQKNTVDIKIKGAKVNLQSEFGTFAKSVAAGKPKLKWRDENGLTEVYVSQTLLEELGLNVGDLIVDKAFKAMGFRLPSSGLHSGIGLIIKGTYPSPSPETTNVIIAPSRIVHVHGSDYDIDSLSIIIRSRTKDVFTSGTAVNLGSTLDKALGTDTFSNDPMLILAPNQVLGYTNYNPNNRDESFNPIEIEYEGEMLPLDVVLEIAIDKVREEAKALMTNRTMDKNERKKRLAELIGEKGNYELSLEFKLIKVYQAIQKNKIVDNFVNLLTTETSRKWGDMPISMARFNIPRQESQNIANPDTGDEQVVTSEEGLLSIVARMKGETTEEQAKTQWRSILYPPVDPSSVVDQSAIHRNSTSGLVIRGAGANAIKIFAYSLLGAKTSHFERIGDSSDILDINEAKELAKTPAGRQLLRQYKRIRQRVEVDPNIDIRFNGIRYNKLSTIELEKSSDPNAGKNETQPKEVIVGFDKDGNPIKKVYSVWETLDSLINAAIDNVKEQIIYLINLTGGTASEYFAGIMLGIPMDTMVRFISSPALFELSFKGEIKRGNSYGSMYKLIESVASKGLNELALSTMDKELSSILNKKYSDLTPAELDRLPEAKKALEEEIANTVKSLGVESLTDRNMEESAITINKLMKETGAGNLTNLLYKILAEPGASSKKEIVSALLIQFKVMEQYSTLSKIGNKLFTAQVSMDVLRQLDPTYTGLKDKFENMITEVSTFGGPKSIREFFNKSVLPNLDVDKAFKEELTEEEIETLEKSEDKEDPRVKIAKLLKRFMNSAKGIEAGNKNAVNQLLRGEDSNFSRPATGWPFINSSLLSVPNVRESFITVMQVINLIESIIIKHSMGMNKMTELVSNMLGTRNEFSSKYDIMEDIKNQFVNYYFSSLNIPLEGTMINTELQNTNIRDWTLKLKDDIVLLRDYLDSIGKPNLFLNNLEFSYDRNMNGGIKIIFTAHKKNDPEVEAELKQAFLDLGNLTTKLAIKEISTAWVDPYRVEFPNVGGASSYSDISLRLIKYLLISKGLDFGRVSYSTILPDSFYTALSQMQENQPAYEQAKAAIEARQREELASPPEGATLESIREKYAKELSDLEKNNNSMEKFTKLNFKIPNSAEYVNKHFLAILDDFLNQYALNNASKLQYYTENDVVLINKAEEGYIDNPAIHNHNSHYDLLVKKSNSPEFVTYKYGNETRVYRKIESFNVTQEMANEAFPEGGYHTYRFIGYSNFNRHYTLTQETKNNGYSSKSLLQYPIIREKGVLVSSVTLGNIKVPYRNGMRVIVVDSNKPGLTNPRLMEVTSQVVNEETKKVTYILAPVSDNNKIDTSYDVEQNTVMAGRVLNQTIQIMGQASSSIQDIEGKAISQDEFLESINEEINNMDTNLREHPEADAALDPDNLEAEEDFDVVFAEEYSQMRPDFPVQFIDKDGNRTTDPNAFYRNLIKYFKKVLRIVSINAPLNNDNVQETVYRRTLELFKDTMKEKLSSVYTTLNEVDSLFIKRVLKFMPMESATNAMTITRLSNTIAAANEKVSRLMPSLYREMNRKDKSDASSPFLSPSHDYDLQSFLDILFPLITDPEAKATLRELVRINPGAKLKLSKALVKVGQDNKFMIVNGSYSNRGSEEFIHLALGRYESLATNEYMSDSEWANKLANTLAHELAHRSTVFALTDYYAKWNNRHVNPQAAKAIPTQVLNIIKAYEEMKAIYKLITQEELDALSSLDPTNRFKANSQMLDYAFSNIKEFTAYMYTDPNFKKIVEMLGNKLGYKVGKKKQTVGTIIVDRIKEWFRELLTMLLGRPITFNGDKADRASVLTGYNALYTMSMYSNVIRRNRKTYDFKDNRETAFGGPTKDVITEPLKYHSKYKIYYDVAEDTDNTEPVDGAETATPKDTQTDSVNKILQSPNVDGVYLTEDDDSGKYVDSNGKQYNRLTEFISTIFFSSMSSKVREPEYYARRDFAEKGIPETGTISKKVDNGKEQLFTFEQLVEYHKRKSNNYKTWGKAAHAFIELLLTRDPAKREQIQLRLSELTKPRYDENGNMISDPVDLSAMKWLMGEDKKISISISDVLRAAGITMDFKNPDFNKAMQSMSLPELPIVMPGIDLGTTIDNLFIDSDGTYTILDWKTGALLSDFNNPEIMQWGANEGINLTKLNKAKLEVVMRMMALKLANPEAKFKNMSIVWIGNQGRYKIHNIDMQPFLNVLSEYMKSEQPIIFNEYKAKGLFDAKNYLSNNKYQARYEESLSNMDTKARIEWTKNRIQFLQLKYAAPNVPYKNKIKAELMDLSKLLVELEGNPGINYEAPSKDMTSLSKVTSNIKDVNNPIMKVFSKTMLTNKFNAEQEQSKVNEEYNKMFEPVLQEYLNKNSVYKTLYTLSGGRITSLFGAGLNKKQLYSFMWKYHNSEGKLGYYANLSNVYTDLVTGEENIPMTNAQIAFRDWYLETQRNLYKEMANVELIDDKGTLVKKYKLQQIPEDLYDDFMPRKQKSRSDILESNKGILSKTREVIDNTLLENFTDVFEHTFEGDPTRGIPLRYYSNINSEIISSEEHTFDIEESFKQFTNNVIFKKHMDEVYSFGEGLKFYFAEAKNEFGKQLYPNLSKFIEDHIILHILQTTPQGNFFGKEFSINVTPKMAEKFKGLNLQEGRITVNAWKISRAIKNWVSLSVMTFKLIPAAGNAALIIISNHFKGFTGSLATRVFNIPPEDVEFTMSDVLSADGAILKYWGKRLIGRHKNDKLYNMTRKLKFLPDNYDFYTNREDMKVVKNALFTTGTAYLAHSIFEEYGAMTMLYSGLKASKFTFTHKETGETKVSNLYDMYDNLGDYDSNWVRGKTKINGELVEIGAITADELQKFKRFHERVHGSYRREERLAAELTIMGQWALQFKKYLPTLFKMNWKGPELDRYLGGYKVKLDADGFPVKDEGIDVMEWEEKLTQGRINLLLKSMFVTAKIMPFFGMGEEKGYDTTKYIWDNMSNERKKLMIESVSTILLFMVLPILLMGGFDDDDENKAWYKRINKVFEDASLGMDPRDLLRPLADNPVPSIKYLIDLLDNGASFFAEGMIMGRRDSRDLPKGLYGLMRQLPLGASWHQWNSFMDDYDKNLQFWSYDQR